MNTLRYSSGRVIITPQGSRIVVPVHLPMARAWRWCVMATLRDMRLASAYRGHISLPNYRRLFIRRWATVCWAYELAHEDPITLSARADGIAYVTKYHNRGRNER